MTDSVVKTKISVTVEPDFFVKDSETKWRGTTFMVKTRTPKIGSYEIRFYWEATKDGALPTEMFLASKTKSRITSDLIRKIPIKDLLRLDVERQETNRKQAPERIEWIKRHRTNLAATKLSSTVGAKLSITPEAKLKRAPRRDGSFTRQVLNDELRKVAEAWKENQENHATESFEKYIAKRTGLPRSMIRGRIFQCRKMGLIPPSTHGNATVNRPIKKRKKK